MDDFSMTQFVEFPPNSPQKVAGRWVASEGILRGQKCGDFFSEKITFLAVQRPSMYGIFTYMDS